MTVNEAIEELKNENEQCYDQCEGHCSEIQNNICTCRDAIILSELEQYRAIGTVEECREARERQRGKKPVLSAPCKSINYYLCPNCNKILNINKPFCCDCGSGIDWSEEDV